MKHPPGLTEWELSRALDRVEENLQAGQPVDLLMLESVAKRLMEILAEAHQQERERAA